MQLTETQQQAGRDYNDSFKRAISLVANRTSALLWPLEEDLQFPSDYYNAICAQLSNIAFSKNPSALKRDESIIVLIEINLDVYELSGNHSPSETKEHILTELKKRSEILFENLYKSRDCSGIVISIGSSKEEKHSLLRSSEVVACFETEYSNVYNMDGYLDLNLGLNSKWTPQFMLAVGLRAMENTRILQYKALRFNSLHDPVKLPVARDFESTLVKSDDNVPEELKPQDITASNDRSDHNLAAEFAANPLFESLENKPKTVEEVAEHALKTLQAEANSDDQLIESISIPCKLKDKGDYVMLLTEGMVTLTPADSMSPLTNVVWNDESYLAFSTPTLNLSSGDTILMGAFTKMSSHLNKLDVTTANGSAFEDHIGIELTFKDYLNKFNISAYAGIDSALKDIYNGAL
ncbi:hypothetical protein [Yersinia ruckeri]|uniref:hypothetical protein n=1 Tax=Yersinia ruckeri TaxID=29486 RepID=UPI00223728A0|nr:hypothetical protein [Yersinia ruckeri]MCW6598754.1 hypothetical protein [Yersinia ruckeri]